MGLTYSAVEGGHGLRNQTMLINVLMVMLIDKMCRRRM